MRQPVCDFDVAGRVQLVRSFGGDIDATLLHQSAVHAPSTSAGDVAAGTWASSMSMWSLGGADELCASKFGFASKKLLTSSESRVHFGCLAKDGDREPLRTLVCVWRRHSR